MMTSPILTKSLLKGGAAVKAAVSCREELLTRRKNMQTKLRMAVNIFAASLLSVSMISAATVSKAVILRAKSHTHAVGTASWYGIQHQGLKMANGKPFDRRKLTAASWYVPLGTTLRVVNLGNGRSVTVTVTDRGPNLRLNRIIDLSEAAARRLGYIDEGLTQVFVIPLFSYAPQHAELRRSLVKPSRALVATYTAPAPLPALVASAP